MEKLKGILAFIKKTPMIIRAKIRNKKRLQGLSWYKKRLEICADCPFNSKNKQEKTARYYLLSVLNLRNDFCTDCGCELKAKASEELEACPQGKWQQETIEE
jgi:hypothetical protein